MLRVSTGWGMPWPDSARTSRRWRSIGGPLPEPDIATYHYNCALSLVRLGEDQAAREAFTRALDLDPRFLEAWIELANLLGDLGRYDEALVTLGKAAEIESDSGEVPFYRAILFEKQGRLEEALAELEESLRLDPDSIYTLNNKGNVLMDLGRLDEALACFDEILGQTTRYPLAHYNRACVLARLGKVRETVRELSLAAAEDDRFLDDALEDPDFEKIRRTPSFRRLLDSKKARP